MALEEKFERHYHDGIPRLLEYVRLRVESLPQLRRHPNWDLHDCFSDVSLLHYFLYPSRSLMILIHRSSMVDVLISFRFVQLQSRHNHFGMSFSLNPVLTFSFHLTIFPVSLS